MRRLGRFWFLNEVKWSYIGEVMTILIFNEDNEEREMF